MNPRNYTATAVAVCRVCRSEAPAQIARGEHVYGGVGGAYTVRPPGNWTYFRMEGAPHPTCGLLCPACRTRPITDIPLGTVSIQEMFRVEFRGKCGRCSLGITLPPEWLSGTDGGVIPKSDWPTYRTRWRELRDFDDRLVCPDCYLQLYALVSTPQPSEPSP